MLEKKITIRVDEALYKKLVEYQGNLEINGRYKNKSDIIRGALADLMDKEGF